MSLNPIPGPFDNRPAPPLPRRHWLDMGPDVVRIKAGTVEVEVDALGMGWVKLGGVELENVCGVTVRIRAGEVPSVSIDVLPI